MVLNRHLSNNYTQNVIKVLQLHQLFWWPGDNSKWLVRCRNDRCYLGKHPVKFFLWSNSPKQRFLSKQQHFFWLPLYVESSSSMTNCCYFHVRYIGCNDVFIFLAHHWVTIFKFAIKSLIFQLQNYMSNLSPTVSVLFDSSQGSIVCIHRISM